MRQEFHEWCVPYCKFLYGFQHGIAWESMGIHGNAEETIRSRAGTHVSRHGEKLSAWWPIKEAIRGCMG